MPSVTGNVKVVPSLPQFGDTYDGQKMRALVQLLEGLNLNFFIENLPIPSLVPDATASVKGILKLSGRFAGTADSPALANSGVTPGAYGSNTEVATFTVGADGTISLAGNAAIDFSQHEEVYYQATDPVVTWPAINFKEGYFPGHPTIPAMVVFKP